MKKISRKFVSTALLMGATTLSMALGSVPHRSRVTDDTAIYQRLSETKVKKQGDLNFDPDIAQLSSLESRYAEKLPALSSQARLNSPSNRISSQRYQYTGAKKTWTARKSVQAN